MKDTTQADIGGKSVKHVLKSIIKTHPWKLSITGSLVLAENGLELVYPIAAGIALDAVLQNDIMRALYMVGIIFLFWLIGAIRRAVDTRIYTKIYGDLAGNVIESERNNNVSASVTIAHTTLARQFVDFFEEQVPAFVTALVSVGGSVVMLLILEPVIGGIATLVLLGFIPFGIRFTGRAEYLASCLHDRQEYEPDVVTSGKSITIKRHFKVLAGRRVALSDLEARAYIVVGMVIAGLFGTLFVYLSGREGITAGHIYMVMSYIWTFAFSLDEMPAQLQQVGRIKELGSRIRAEDEH